MYKTSRKKIFGIDGKLVELYDFLAFLFLSEHGTGTDLIFLPVGIIA